MHHHTRGVGALVVALVASSTLLAARGAAGAQPADDLLARYRSQALGSRFSFGGLKLERDGQLVDLSFFGGNATEIFAGSDRALASMRSYRTLRISGTALWATGLTVLAAEIVLLLARRDLFIDELPTGNELKPLFWAMLAGGGVVGISGGIMMQGANAYLSDAVRHYNDDLVRRLRGGAVAATGGLVLGHRGRF